MSITVTDGNGSWEVDDPFELWRLLWGALAFAISTEAAFGKCPGCGCEVMPCIYCLHECHLSA